VNILLFLDRRERVLSVESFEFFPISLFEVKAWSSSVGVANGSKLDIDVYEDVVGIQTWEVAPFACGS